MLGLPDDVFEMVLQVLQVSGLMNSLIILTVTPSTPLLKLLQPAAYMAHHAIPYLDDSHRQATCKTMEVLQPEFDHLHVVWHVIAWRYLLPSIGSML